MKRVTKPLGGRVGLMAHSTEDGAGRRRLWKHVNAVRMGHISEYAGMKTLKEDTCGMWIASVKKLLL